MRSTMGSEYVVTGYVQSYCAVNSEELVRVEEAELHTPLIWLHLRIYWDSMQVEYYCAALQVPLPSYHNILLSGIQ